MARRVNVDARNAYRKLKRVQISARQASWKTVEDLAKLGVSIAKTKAPFDTGYTVKQIKYIPVRSRDGSSARIISKNILKDGHKRNIPNFDLVRWMHETNGRQGSHIRTTKFGSSMVRGHKHIRSGDPRYMYSTRRHLNRIKTSVAKGNFNKLIIR